MITPEKRNSSIPTPGSFQHFSKPHNRFVTSSVTQILKTLLVSPPASCCSHCIMHQLCITGVHSMLCVLGANWAIQLEAGMCVSQLLFSWTLLIPQITTDLLCQYLTALGSPFIVFVDEVHLVFTVLLLFMLLISFYFCPILVLIAPHVGLDPMKPL